VETLRQGIKICDDLNLKPYSAQGHLYLYELYSIAGQMDKATASRTKATQMFQEMGMSYWEARANKSLVGTSSPKGN
jgi:protein involved in temperature-dependent protein secretion